MHSSQFLRRGVALIAMLLASQILALAQSQYEFDQGMRPFGAYHAGDIDSINLSSGALSVTIPLISYPQRGGKLNLEYALQYNSSSSQAIYGCIQFANTGSCAHYGLTINGKLDTFNLVDRQQVIENKYTQTTTAGSGMYSTWVTTDIITLINSDGGRHNTTWTNSAGSILRSTDATGFYGGSSHLWDRSGIDYGGPTTSQTCPLWTPDPANQLINYCNYSRTDPNNNNISFSQSSGWTDTLGRNIPLPTVSSDPAQFTGCSNGANGTYPTAYVELWNPPGSDANGRYPIKFCYFTQTFSYTYPPVPGYNPSGPETFTRSQLQNVVLPDGKTWTFLYAVNTYAYVDDLNLTKIILPTGGSISYGWTKTSTAGACSNDPKGMQYETDAVGTRTLDPADGVNPAGTWTYTYGPPSQGVTTVHNPDGSRSVHTFGVEGPPGTSDACYPYENQVIDYDVNGTLLKTLNTTYSYSPSSISSSAKSVVAATNVVPATVTTIWPGGQQRQTKYKYDSGNFPLYGCYTTIYGRSCVTYGQTGIYGTLLEQWESDYGSGAPGGWLSDTQIAYKWQTDSPTLNANLLDLVSSATVLDSNNNKFAKTTYEYDTSGNQTWIHRWIDSSGKTADTKFTYGSYGLVSKMDAYLDSGDTKSEATTHNYSLDCNNNAATYAGNGPTSTTDVLGHCNSTAYNFNTGLVTRTTDQNGQSTSYSYDSMERPTTITYPPAPGDSNGYNKSVFTYNDSFSGGASSTPNVTVARGINISGLQLTRIGIVDGLGRKTHTQLTSDPDGTDVVDTTYDAVGRVYSVSNGYRPGSPATTNGTITYAYDGLGRTVQVTEQDGSSVSTDYSAFPCITVTDESGKKRRSCSDGLERVTGVWEDPAGLNYETDYQYDSLGNLLQVKQHGGTGDTMRTRVFTYDFLSRLITASNPESGLVCYGIWSSGSCINGYDNVNNLLSKTDARGVTVNYAYDLLNRIYQKTYSQGSSSTSDPAACMQYDKPGSVASDAYPIGRLTMEWTQPAGVNCNQSYSTLTPPALTAPPSNAITSTVMSHDQMGRVGSEVQCPYGSACGSTYTFNYGYDLAGDMTQFNNGMPASGSSTTSPAITWTASYDGAARLSLLQASTPWGTSNSNFPPFLVNLTFTNPASYTASNQVAYELAAQMSTGSTAGVNISNGYDNRLRTVSETAVGSGTVYNYIVPSGGYSPNGNLLAHSDSVMGDWTFQYDTLNRLTVMAPSINAPVAFKGYLGCYAYDAFGNRTINASPNTGCTSFPASNYSVYNARNQLTTFKTVQANGQTNATLTYDAAGNVANDGTNMYVYDGEGRVCAAENLSTTTATAYIYDAEGWRTAKGRPANAALPITTQACNLATNGFAPSSEYLLDLGGDQVTELNNAVTGTSALAWAHSNVWAGAHLTATYDMYKTSSSTWAPALHFHLSDPLGTRRVQINPQGQIESTFQSLPFGDGLTVNKYDPNTGIPLATADDATEHHFTGKERDAETGLDYFGARYYSGAQGRFMTPDWSSKPTPVPYATLGNPQSLNLYVYVMNNPLSRNDPDGHCDSLLCKWLNVVEVKVTAGIQAGISGQFGVVKGKAQATLIGAEAKTGLGGGDAEAKVQTKASASASAGKASASASIGGQVSTSDGASASATAKVSVGPVAASASAIVDQNGARTSASTSVNPRMSVDTDSKLGFGFNAILGGEVSINFSQMGRAADETKQSLENLGSYLMNKFAIQSTPKEGTGVGELLKLPF
jgi:RHS repeat-associated protein